jgi:glycosyltransferase involved in cell wall biosynthesis
MAIPVSAIVLTKNEEEMLPGCLESLAWADEILVVDSFSTDRTVEIARRAGARVVQHPLCQFRGHSATMPRPRPVYDWCFLLMRMTGFPRSYATKFATWLPQIACPSSTLIIIQRVHLFSGRWIPDPTRRRVTPRLRAWIRCTEVPRLFDRRPGYLGTPLHEVVRVPEPARSTGWRSFTITQ